MIVYFLWTEPFEDSETKQSNNTTVLNIAQAIKQII